jgi:hypothetical protein
VTGRIRRDAVKIMRFARLHVDTLVAFEDYELPKPNPQPLLIAVQRLGVEPSSSVYIGPLPGAEPLMQWSGNLFTQPGDTISIDFFERGEPRNAVHR